VSRHVREHTIETTAKPSIKETVLNTKLIVRNVALMVMFGALGLGLFTENVKTVQVLGLFITGIGFGASLATIISAVRSKTAKDAV